MSERLAIAVMTEDGHVLDRPDVDEMGSVLRRIGWPGDHFVVVTRIPDEVHAFIQAWRDGTGAFAVEFRDGAPERHFVTWIDGPDAAVTLFHAWAVHRTDWGDAYTWQPLESAAPPPITDERRRAAEEFVRLRVDSGFDTRRAIVEDLLDYFEPEPLIRAQAVPIVTDIWERRLAEQAEWPETTDPDRVATVFQELDERGITARMHFTCCGNCGQAEIGAEAAEDARGYTFFHRQDTERVARGGDLWLSFGGFTETTAAVGHEVNDALSAAGLSAVWDGSPGTAIRVTGLDWHKRLL